MQTQLNPQFQPQISLSAPVIARPIKPRTVADLCAVLGEVAGLPRTADVLFRLAGNRLTAVGVEVVL